MIDGVSGNQMGYVPIGVVSYMALKHRSYKKIQARGLFGKKNCITRQPTEGRKRNGGLGSAKWKEMPLFLTERPVF